MISHLGHLNSGGALKMYEKSSGEKAESVFFFMCFFATWPLKAEQPISVSSPNDDGSLSVIFAVESSYFLCA